MTTGDAVEDVLAGMLRRIEPRTPYAEAFAQRSSGQSIRLDRTSTGVQPAAEFVGVALRAWGTRGWVESGTSGPPGERWLDSAEQLAQRLQYSGGAGAPPGVPATGSGDAWTKAVRPMADFSVEESLALARTWFGWATGVPGVSNAYATIDMRTEERHFLSTAGARFRQRIDRVRGSVAALAIEGDKVEYDYVSHGGSGGHEILDQVTEERITHAAREAKALLGAASAPAGRMAVLLDPSTSGTFAHESFGHGTEADQILRNRSYLKPLIGTVVGPECLSIADDGTYEGGWGSIFFDDEGHRARKTVLVDHGKFTNVLTDRESAAALERPATGNTRRSDFLSRPFVRMTNTYVEPGDRRFEELLEEVSDGVLLESCTSGIEDPLGGNMQIKVKKGHRIHRGQVLEILPSMALSGKVLDFLRATRGVSRREDFRVSPGYCGKGQTDLVPAGTGGPYLLSEAVVGPA